MGNIAWRDHLQNIAAAGVLLAKWPGSLSLEVQDPLGGVQAAIVLKNNQFWAYQQRWGYGVQGSFQNPRWQRFLPLPLSTEDYLRILLARPKLDGQKSFQAGTEPNSLWINYPGQRKDYLVWDSATEQPSRWEIHSTASQRVEVRYEQYRARFGVPYPKVIEIFWIANGKRRLKLVWQWRDQDQHLPSKLDPFVIPPAWSDSIKTRKLKSD